MFHSDSKLKVAIFATSLVVMPWFLIDAAVLPKFACLMILGALLSFRLITGKRKIEVNRSLKYFLILNAFLCALILSSLAISDNIWLSFFGEYSRFFGAASFLSLLVISVYFSLHNSETLEVALLKIFQYTVIAVSIYYTFQFFGLDFASWEAWFGIPSSFLGNPNFVSAYVAMGLVSLISGLLIEQSGGSQKRLEKKLKIEKTAQIATLILHLFVLVTNGSKQGYLIVAVGGIFVLLLRIPIYRLKKSLIYTSFVVCTVSVFISFSLLGGQLVQLSEIKSRLLFLVTARNILVDNLPFGIGFGEYGYFFREYRDVELANQLEISPDVYSDSAHNLFADLIVSVGPLGLIAYTLIFIVVGIRFVKTPKERTSSRINFFSILLCFLVQALVSPPQLSLLLWGHISLGILASRSKFMSTPSLVDTHTTKKKSQGSRYRFAEYQISRNVRIFLMLVPSVFVFAAIAPTRSDFLFRESLYTQNLETIQTKALSFPTNSGRMRYASSIMCVNGEPNRAAQILDFAIEENARDFENILYYLRLDLPLQKRLMLSGRLQSLDPAPEQNSLSNILKIIPDCLEKK